jgi:L-ribulose-5-phosphate 3-epimerase
MRLGLTVPVGIYEKAIPTGRSWEECSQREILAGNDFVEMSKDESVARQACLRYPVSEHAASRQAISNSEIPAPTISLSGQCKFPMGLAYPEVRQRDRRPDVVHQLAQWVIGYEIRTGSLSARCLHAAIALGD